jgi:hypothetical protein
MADTSSWQLLVTAAVPPLLAGVLSAILPRLWQGELRRLQLESETRVKRLEALEKALSLVGKAKSELGIEVSTQEILNELGRILHELAGPVVLSREVLEDWANEPLVGRLLRAPRFSVPAKEAMSVRSIRPISHILFSLFLLYFLVTFFLVLQSGDYMGIRLMPYLLFYGFTYLILRVVILRDTKSALKAVRAMPKNTAEVKIPALVRAGLLPEATC